jgi:hypothetical protein
MKKEKKAFVMAGVPESKLIESNLFGLPFKNEIFLSRFSQSLSEDLKIITEFVDDGNLSNDSIVIYQRLKLHADGNEVIFNFWDYPLSPDMLRSLADDIESSLALAKKAQRKLKSAKTKTKTKATSLAKSKQGI